MLVILAQALAPVLPTNLPDWIPPSVFVVVGLAVLAGFANQRGYWVSGREHKSMVEAKDKAMADIKDVFKGQLDWVEARRAEERAARVEDARLIGHLTAAAAQASATMEAVERDLSGSDLYREREQPAARRRRQASQGSDPVRGEDDR